MVAKRREEALINEANCIPPPPTVNQSSVFDNRKRWWYKNQLRLLLLNVSIFFFVDCMSCGVWCGLDMDARFRNVAENAILYVGSQHGKLDQISLVLFPLSFLLFASIYWIIYLNESNRHNI